MKTTVEISDALLEETRAVARRERTTMRALIEEGLRRALDQRKRKQRSRVRLVTFKGLGLQPEVTSFEQMLDLTYAGRGS